MFRQLLLLLFLLIPVWSQAQDEKPLVMTLDIRDDIDPRMNRYVSLALDHAKEIEADIIIIHMDTYGGAVTDAKDIVENILAFEKPVWVFIDKDAASAGALISIACDSIYMAPGSSIGAATVVTMDGAAAPDKYQSYMRGTMRSLADEKGRDPRIAEGMVDESIEIEGVTKAGEVITFSTFEAIEFGFCEGKVDNIDEILTKNGIVDYELVAFELPGSERIIAFFLNPVVSGLLILIIIGGIWFELQTPGIGFPIAAAVVAAILYFTPYYLNGLAANWEIILFFLGIILILLEVFVIPGFGIAGISGIILTLGSLILVMVNNDLFDFSFVGIGDLAAAAAAVLVGTLGGMVVLFILGIRFTESKAFSRVALMETMAKSEGYASKFREDSLTGAVGTAYTVLRPSGKVQVGDEIYDAYTRGEYIDKGREIEVIEDAGASLKVRERMKA
ncbi:NfeD family protein [Fulvivirga sedimenti]|uniref:Nodulation protein NfeD n=1 Tax=Fulvivirga sedimenti TaxID=2879465 RepID=A0A9X1HMU0_9BACT|nr:NfeD family protein [Fulvivirga sedimenti]MCA6073900.1 nodulation protein NfeD [Fulvivirga sedimenti]